MRYFEIRTIFGPPHIVRESENLEDFEEALRHLTQVFTMPEMQSHADLQDALDRWVEGDRSPYAHDAARYILNAEDADSVRLKAYLVDDELEAWYREHAATDELAQRMVVLLDLLKAYEALQGPIESLLSYQPRDWSKKEWDEVEGELNLWKRELAQKAAERLESRGRPSHSADPPGVEKDQGEKGT